MKQDSITNTFHTNVNDGFEKEISLWKLITHEPTLEILQRTVLCHQNDVAEGRNPRLPVVLMSSATTGLGAETLARSLASSLAMHLKVGFGSALSYEYQLQEFFQDSTDDTAFYIRESEKLNPSIQQNIFYAIKNQVLKITGRYGEPNQYAPFKNRLIILGTTCENIMIQSLINIFDLRLSLTVYSQELIVKILKQRIEFLGWRVESDAVLDYIALYAGGCPNKAVWHLLQTSYSIMRSESKDVMEMNHVHVALSLVREYNNGT